MTIETKLCGFTTEETIIAALNAGVAYIGFVFFPASPRNITPEEAGKLAEHIREKAKIVAVTVNPEDTLLSTICEHVQPDFFQLHGNESVERVKEIRKRFGVKVIKAIKVRSGDDIASAGQYANDVAMILFDAKPPKDSILPGGMGVSFDWELLKDRRFSFPWMLSGGLHLDNIAEAVHSTGATRIDLSSSVETAPGVKDPSLIQSFLEKVKTL